MFQILQEHRWLAHALYTVMDMLPYMIFILLAVGGLFLLVYFRRRTDGFGQPFSSKVIFILLLLVFWVLLGAARDGKHFFHFLGAIFDMAISLPFLLLFYFLYRLGLNVGRKSVVSKAAAPTIKAEQEVSDPVGIGNEKVEWALVALGWVGVLCLLAGFTFPGPGFFGAGLPPITLAIALILWDRRRIHIGPKDKRVLRAIMFAMSAYLILLVFTMLIHPLWHFD